MSLAGRLFAGLCKPLLTRFLSDVIIYYPGGILTNGVPLRALVALDAELGTNEVPGDGAVTRDVHGDRERRTGRIELPAILAQIDNFQITAPGLVAGITYSIRIGTDTVSYLSHDLTIADAALAFAKVLAASTVPAFAVLRWIPDSQGVTATAGPGASFTIASTGQLVHTNLLAAGAKISESDLWSIDGEIWTTIRQDGRDVGPMAGYQSWRITTKYGRRTQHSLLKDTRPLQRG